MFVAQQQFKVNFPSCIGQLDGFINDVAKLFTFQHDIEIIAQTIEAKLKTQHTKNRSKKTTRHHIRTSTQSPPRHLAPPATVAWFTSPRGQAIFSIIPQINKKLLSQTSDEEVASNSEEEEEENKANDSIDSDSDSDDFIYTKRGWYYKVTKKYFESNPYGSTNN